MLHRADLVRGRRYPGDLSGDIVSFGVSWCPVLAKGKVHGARPAGDGVLISKCGLTHRGGPLREPWVFLGLSNDSAQIPVGSACVQCAPKYYR